MAAFSYVDEAPTEQEFAVGAGKLFGMGNTVTSSGSTAHAYKLLNPNGSGVTVRLKRITIYCGTTFVWGLMFNQAPSNLGTATAGLNLKQGGSAAQATLAGSSNAGTAPALTNALMVIVNPSGGGVTVDVNVQFGANNYVVIWTTGAAATGSQVSFTWEEY